MSMDKNNTISITVIKIVLSAFLNRIASSDRTQIKYPTMNACRPNLVLHELENPIVFGFIKIRNGPLT